jgi:L-lactate dehydrogenase complex protein LldG
MNSKEQILNKLSTGKAGKVEQLPAIDVLPQAASLEKFEKSIEEVGGSVIQSAAISNWNKWLAEKFGTDLKVYSEYDRLPGNFVLHPESAPKIKEQLNSIDVAVIHGKLGVVENGAIWVVGDPEHRAIPFIAEHLILILKRSIIVPTMHDAYEVLTKVEMPGFGVFISGPSKTADIEQSLVYGAQGPKSLIVILTESNE